MTYRFGWLSTGRDKAARDLLSAAYQNIKKGSIKGEISFVFCSREPGESAESDLFHELVREYGIPLVHFSYQRFKANQHVTDQQSLRLKYDREVMKRLEKRKVDLCVLAGYMLIVGRKMCQKYNMINLHPAAPGGPAGTWQEVIWQLIAGKARETGVMMHLVTPELDRGPVVTFCKFSIKGKAFDEYWKEIEGQPVDKIKRAQGENNRLFHKIREYGLVREFPLIIATMKAFSEVKVKISVDKKVIDASGNTVNGYDLTAEIENLIK